MSQTALINFNQLEDFLEKEGASEEDVQLWYDKLTEYDIDGNESREEIELLFNAARYVMGFTFTAAEELRNVAENEAIHTAEREAQWEEEKMHLSENLERLREQITSKAEVGDSTEAFRAQIDSLKQENRELQQANRARDREMADQRDRYENLAARVDILMRERDALQDHKIHLEDTIRELNRRLTSKTEGSTVDDWESKKLKLRNEQVLTISRQMRAVVSQNEELREEVERVSNALEEATKVIDDSADRYANICQQLDEAHQSIDDLTSENRRLTEGLPEALVDRLPKVMKDTERLAKSGEPLDRIELLQSVAELFAKNLFGDDEFQLLADSSGYTRQMELEQKLARCHDKISLLQTELSQVLEESNQLRARIRDDRTDEKEEQLEQLREELVHATKLARSLFGESVNPEASDNSAQMRIFQLERSVAALNEQLDEKNLSIEQLTAVIEQKDESNAEINSELLSLRKKLYGEDGWDELKHFQQQLKFRDEQIAKLRQQCTLLHVELGRYAERAEHPTVSNKNVATTRNTTTIRPKSVTRPSPKKEVDTHKPILTSSGEESVEEESKEEKSDPEPEPKREITKSNKSDRHESVSDISNQSMLISNLYYEIMQLLEELEQRDKTIKEVKDSWTKTKANYDELRAQLDMAYEDLKMHKYATEEIEPVKKELENIRTPDQNQILENATKERLIQERNQLSRRCDQIKNVARGVQEYTKQKSLQFQEELSRLKNENQLITIECAKLHNRLLNCVPIEIYDSLMLKYRKIVGSQVQVEINDPPPRPHLPPIELSEHDKDNNQSRMLDLIGEQRDHYANECAILRDENDVLRAYIDKKTRAKEGVTAQLVQRLLDAIHELRENEHKLIMEKRSEKSRKKKREQDLNQWRNERMVMIDAIRILQKENANLRAQFIGNLSLKDLEELRNRIVETRSSEVEVKAKQEEATAAADEARFELMRSRAEKTASEIINTKNRTEINQQIEIALINSSRLSMEKSMIEKKLHRQSCKIAELSEDLKESQQQNLELLTTLENLKIIREEKKSENIFEEKETNNETLSTIKNKEEEVEGKVDVVDELNSEISSTSSDSENQIIVKTIVRDDSKRYESQLNDIRNAARIALQGYKEQLVQKDEALAKYRQLLQDKIEEEQEVIEKIEFIEKKVVVRDEGLVEELRNAREELMTLKNKKQQAAVHISTGCQTEKEDETPKIEENSGDETEEVELIKSPIIPLNNEENNAHSRALEIEVSKLRKRVAQLTGANRKLVETCETIKRDAIEELSTFRNNLDDRRVTEQRIEMDQIRASNKRLISRNNELSKTVERLEQEIKQNTIIVPNNNSNEDWERRKRQEETIQNLRHQLNNANYQIDEFNTKIDKRDKLIETLRRDQVLRESEIEKFKKKLKQVSQTKEEVGEYKQKIIELQNVIVRKTEEQTKSTTTLNQINRKYEEYRKKSYEQMKAIQEKSQISKVSRSTSPPSADGRNVQQKTTENGKSTESSSVENSIKTSEFTIMKRSLRLAEVRLIEYQEQLSDARRDIDRLNEKCQTLQKRIPSREDKPTGAVLVLSDKLAAKDREIAQLKTYIAHLERSVNIP